MAETIEAVHGVDEVLPAGHRKWVCTTGADGIFLCWKARVSELKWSSRSLLVDLTACTLLLSNHGVSAPRSLRARRATVLSRGASALLYFTCSMNARSLGKT